MTMDYLRFKKRILTIVGISFCLAAIYSISIRLRLAEYSSVDLIQDYTAARHLFNHESIYIDTEYINYHPPFIALLSIPLALLPYKYAILTWSAFSIVLYILSGWLILKELKIKLPSEYILILTGFSLSWHPFLMNIGLGQWSIVIGLLIVLSWISLRHDRSILAGILLGIACLIKFYPGLLMLYMLFTKRWKALVITIFVVVLGTVITGLVLGPQELVYYFTTVASSDVNRYSTFPNNYSTLGILGKLFANGDNIKPIYVSPIPITTLSLILNCGILIALIRLMFTLPSDEETNDIKYALFLVAMFFISPVTWNHNLVVMILPIFILLKIILQKNIKMKYEYVVLLLGLVLLSIPDVQFGRFLGSLTPQFPLPWYIGIGFLFYDVGLILLVWMLTRSINMRGKKAPTI